jgi:integration host factor subunit beta
MIKSELTDAIRTRFPDLEARAIDISVGAILKAMAQTLSEAGRIEIRGFGSFSVQQRPPRVGRNPRSGESVNVPAKGVIRFKAGKELRERVGGV